MNEHETDRLTQLVHTLLRQPEAADDVQARRALSRLMAARPDAAYLLLQRALVLELALERVQAQQAASREAVTAADADAATAQPAPDAPRAAALSRPSPFVRDAATIAAGIVAGGLVLGGINRLGEALAGDDVAAAADPGLGDWF